MVEVPNAEPWWRRVLGAAGAVVLGAVLLVAAWSKAIDPAAFAEQIRAEGLDAALPAAAVVWIALALEAGLGMALLLAVRRLPVLVPAALLVAFFLFLTGRQYWRFAHGIVDEAAACGCFGNLLSRTPAQAFWQDLALLVLPLALAFFGRPRGGRLPLGRLAPAGAAAVAAVLLAWKAPELPLDDLATRLEPGVEIAELCVGALGQEGRVCLDALVPELEEGRHLVVITGLDTPAFLEAIDELDRRAAAGDGPALWVLCSAELEELRAFRWEWAPAFEIREAPEALLRPLYRSLPRSFLVEGGAVEETWSGLPLEG